jgi:hypothetical protein
MVFHRFLITVLTLPVIALPRVGISETDIHVESRPGGTVTDLRLPVNESVQPFLRGGAHIEEPDLEVTSSEASSDEVVTGVVGAGISFFLNPRHEIRTSYEYQPVLNIVSGDHNAEGNNSNIRIGYHFNF